MKLRTEIELPAAPFRIDHQTQLLSIGSCFADRMGDRLLEHKFPIQVNPFGVLYNPFSIRKLLEAALNQDHSLADDLFQHNGRWHSFHFHSNFSHPNREQVAETIRDSLHLVRKFLLESRVLILTFGTAWTWKRKTTQEIVANCHKVPTSEFTRELLQLNPMLLAWANTLNKLRQLNPEIQVLLTVSPIRHTREGLANNHLSKSLLRLLCHEMEQNIPQIHYFPAFEIMMDDLRDYRFYKSDLIHPNELAETYIWKCFTETFCSEETRSLNSEWEKLQRSLAHRPFNPGSTEHRDFLQKLLNRLKKMNDNLNCEAEIRQVQTQLASFSG